MPAPERIKALSSLQASRSKAEQASRLANRQVKDLASPNIPTESDASLHR